MTKETQMGCRQKTFMYMYGIQTIETIINEKMFSMAYY